MKEPLLVVTNEHIESEIAEYSYTFSDYEKLYEWGENEDYNEYI